MKNGLWILLVSLIFALGACSPKPPSNQDAYNPCGELQQHLLESQQIDEELTNATATEDQQAKLKERKQFLQRTDERLRRDCGR
jgi:ABC-type transport system involved in cytochrome bd biosynthesis fused ATPase/permease subunit